MTGPTATAGKTGLGEKWHGVPLAAWVLGGTVGFMVLWKLYTSRKGKAAAPAAQATSATGAPGWDPYSWLGMGSGSPSTPTSSAGAGTVAPTSSPPSSSPVQPFSQYTDNPLKAGPGQTGSLGGINYRGTPSGVPVISSGQLAGDYLGRSTVDGSPIALSSAYNFPTGVLPRSAPSSTLAQGNATPGHGEGNTPGSAQDIQAQRSLAALLAIPAASAAPSYALSPGTAEWRARSGLPAN